MSKKFKSQASSARAASALTGGFGTGSAFQTTSSPLAYVTEAPDLSQISQPQVVVALKNLSKKDGVTKAKALEELQDFFLSFDYEESILVAWCDLYPRTSIDNSRRVRQLSHTLQGILTRASGKRIAPFLPKVIGSWLAGVYDSDKSVARAAQEALEKSFPSQDKRQALWTIYEETVSRFVEDSTTIQTRATLSDERTTTPDDAEAKYVRVVGSALHLLSQIVALDAEVSTMTSKLLGEQLIWNFAHHNDSYLRRSICTLATSAARRLPDQLDWRVMSTCFISKGLISAQTGSSLSFVSALLALTKAHSDIWTKDYGSKTNVSKKLYQFLRKGTQQGSANVWAGLTLLLKTIPADSLMNEDRLDSARTLVSALRTGVCHPSERLNAVPAWTAYVEIGLWLLDLVGTDRDTFADECMSPLFPQYISQTENTEWSIPTNATQICSFMMIGMVRKHCRSAFEKAWTSGVASVIDAMKMSLPETSKEYQSSQEAVIAAAKRLFGVWQQILSDSTDDSEISSMMRASETRMLHEAISLLVARKGKPFAAASIMKLVLQKSDVHSTDETLQRFLQIDLPDVMGSPSAEQLAFLTLKYGIVDMVETVLLQPSKNTLLALCYILQYAKSSDLSGNLQQQVKIRASRLTDSDSRQIAKAILQNSSLRDMQAFVVNQLEQTLHQSSSSEQQGAFKLIEDLLSLKAAEWIFISSDENSVVSKLLLLTDSDDDTAEQARALTSRIGARFGAGISSKPIIQQQLNGEPAPLSIYTLIELANDALEKGNLAADMVFPSSQQWQVALNPHLSSPRPASLAITSPLQGALYEIDASKLTVDDGVRDADSFSLAFRLTLYSVRIASNSGYMSKVDSVCLQALHNYLPIALELVNEKLTADNANELWLYSTPDVLQEAVEVVGSGNTLIQSWLEDETFVDSWVAKAHDFDDRTTSTYCKALAWTHTIARVIARQGPSVLLDAFEDEVKTLHQSTAIFRSAAILSVLGDHLSVSSLGKRTVNELVAACSSHGFHNETAILLNILLSGQYRALEAIPAHRRMLLLKNLLNQLDVSAAASVHAECMKLIVSMLPLVDDMYGDHWERLVAHLIKCWDSDIDLPLLNASLKLYANLRSHSLGHEANQDLVDALTTSQSDIDSGLLRCLFALTSCSTGVDQPRDITAKLLGRLLKQATVEDESDLFELLSCPIEAVQTAAYEILCRTIPQQQEQLSVDLVLEKVSVNLPNALITQLDDRTNVRQFLLAWSLVFVHFTKASFLLRETYTSDLKNRGHLDNLLDLVCEVLRITDGRPVDASRYELPATGVDDNQTPEQELQMLSINNYYSALLYLPSLAKEWFVSQKNRIKTPLESWTQKYISPLLIAASLAAVTEWALAQTNDDKPLEIKTSPKGSDLTASIEIDPENPPISLSVSLPGSYPLEAPVVLSRMRVGVSEKNWQSWMRTIQIIIFSTGSIIEGLVAFRRNVQGALKGQSECAICYSIIGTDKQTPNKTCGTCKNTFHGSCLFRWFKSSNSSSCPLCRNNFNYA